MPLVFGTLKTLKTDLPRFELHKKENQDGSLQGLVICPPTTVDNEHF